MNAASNNHAPSVETARATFLLTEQGTTFLLSAFASALVAYGIRELGVVSLAVWLGCLWGALSMRFAVCIAYFKALERASSGEAAAADPVVWRNRYATTSIFVALSWGALAGFIPIIASTTAQTAVVLTLLGITAAAVAANAADLKIAKTFIILCLAPLVFVLLTSQADGFAFLGFLAAIYAFVMIRFAKRIFNQVTLTFVTNAELSAANASSQALNEELRAARDEALNATKSKSEFLANMSHELRTPMNGVLGMTQLLLRSELSERQRGHARTIEQCGHSLLGLIGDILDYSDLESGTMRVESVAFSLREVLETAALSHAGAASDKNVELVFDISDSIPQTIQGDPVRIAQITSNLVENAVKFTHEGEIVLRASGEMTAYGFGMRVQVCDTGIGIADTALSEIFSSFHQADGSSTRAYGGVGLGLPIARRLVEFMGGELTVRSELGQGSTFTFTLFASMPNSDTGPGAPIVNSDFEVWLLEQNETRAEVLSKRVQSCNLALRRISPTELDALGADPQPQVLLVVDANVLANQNTRELIAQYAHSSRIRAIVLSAPAANYSGDELQQLGFSACVSKPVRDNELLAAIEAAIDDAPQAKSA
ncbi:MAG: hypothetical protein K0U93_05050 [Gammaproteobacteria bacterium]|nr:hypothetical protein [Gammaproteobacteria bacterium]